MRHNLSSICADFDVYEWMVVATLPLDAPTWELKSARSEMEKLRDEMQALKLVHAQEHASLLEHQKAFALEVDKETLGISYAPFNKYVPAGR